MYESVDNTYKVRSVIIGKFLQELTSLISKEIQGADSSPCQNSDPGEELLAAEISAQTKVNEFNRKIVILNLLASICEEIGPSCLKDTHQILKFVQVRNGTLIFNIKLDLIGYLYSKI